MKKTPKKIYKFTCGHVSHAKTKNRKKVCPKCDAKIVGRWLKCDECGEGFVGRKTGRMQKLCPKHQALKTKEWRARRDAARDARIRRAIQAEKNRIERRERFLAEIVKRKYRKNMKQDCVIFEHCLEWDLKKDQDHCLTCKRYSPKSSLRFHGGDVYEKGIRAEKRLLQEM